MQPIVTIRAYTDRHPAILATVVSAAIIVVLAFVFRPRAPLALVHSAWMTIHEAKGSKSVVARGLVSSARGRYDRAWKLIENELDKPLPFRSFRQAEIQLLQAIALAEEAETMSLAADVERREELEGRLANLRELLHHHDEEARDNLHTIALRQLTTSAYLKIDMAERQLATLEGAEPAVAEAEDAVYELTTALEASDQDSDESARMASHWIVETLDWTLRTDSLALVVVKARHCGYVIKQGKVMTSFPVDLGFRSERPKLYDGDGATPEGVYRIAAKRDSGAAYYRALDLNYPNREDWTRFETAQQVGLISPYARIGGNIQVHGEGGRGSDWTEGCVAVANEQMDILMEQFGVGDWVTIVRRIDGWPQ